MLVTWRAPATADLERIVEHISASNPIAARRIARDLVLAAEGLVTFPNRGRVASSDGIRELVAVRPYILVYQVRPGRILILRVWHAAQDRP